LAHVHDHGHAHAHDIPREREHLVFGVPKKGRLYEQVNKMLKGAGIEYTRKDRIDIAQCSNLPMSIVFLPAKDIPVYVGEGDVDLGITGEDMVAECEAEVKVLMQLGFGKCNLSVQAPKEKGLQPKDLAGMRIVTSFPNITRKFFQELEQEGCPTQIKCISGSVEAACGLGLADGIVDLVETGTTMRAAGLEEVTAIMMSQSVLIMNPKSKHPELIEIVRKRIAGYLMAQSWVMVTYNVHRFNLKRAEEITPGARSPSIQPLEDNNWVAVAALVPKAKAPAIMDELEMVGAKDILLTALLSTRMG
jgi:ATP phosphoribosyltransferase